MNALLPLVNQLKSCPTQDERISPQRLIESWHSFKSIAPERGDTIIPALVIGVMLYDLDGFAGLLPLPEREQLIQLSHLAFDRYRQRTNPPNKLGKTIAATLKEAI